MFEVGRYYACTKVGSNENLNSFIWNVFHNNHCVLAYDHNPTYFGNFAINGIYYCQYKDTLKDADGRHVSFTKESIALSGYEFKDANVDLSKEFKLIERFNKKRNGCSMSICPQYICGSNVVYLVYCSIATYFYYVYCTNKLDGINRGYRKTMELYARSKIFRCTTRLVRQKV